MKVSKEKMNRPKKFILTLFEIINDPQNTGTIEWTDTGSSFAILNLPQLTSRILPQHFKHKNISSFIRQLNMYGFHKVRDTGDVIVYSHPDFSQGSPDKLVRVDRKSGEAVKLASDKEKRLLRMNNKQKLLIERVAVLENEMKTINENKRMIVSQVEQYCDRQRKLEQIVLMFLQEVREFPYSLERIYLNVMERNNGSACFNGFT